LTGPGRDEMRVSARSDVGLVREVNQDAFCHKLLGEAGDVRLCAVADGIGGYRAGEVASRLALEALAEELEKAVRAGGPLDRALADAMNVANQKIVRHGLSDPECLGMGTTVTSALISGDRAYIGHVGDSRAYLFRGGRVVQLTRDHSLVAELVRNGNLTEEQAERHPQRNVLTQAFGSDLRVKADVTSVPLEDGDLLLLCTDGLTRSVSVAEIEEVLSGAEDLDEACDRLVAMANERGGYDNVTVLIAGPVRVRGGPA